MTAAARVSVVCATYRRPDSVAALVRALEAQDLGEDFEVVISDDGSGPEVQEALRAIVAGSRLPIRLLEHTLNRGPGAARNDGWRAATGDVIAFTDDDCQPLPGWLRAGVSAMSTGGVVVVGQVSPDPAQASRLGPWSRTLTVRDTRFFQTANAFYRRSDLEAVGGFDEQFVLAGGEDTDLGLRVVALGRRAVFSEDAHVLHDVRAGTVSQLAREAATKWVDLPLVLRKHPEMRKQMPFGLFWKDSHPPTLLALIALPLALRRRPWLVMAAPWLWFRLLHRPRASWRLRRVTLLPGSFLIDGAEVAGCVRGSIRHRTLLL